MYKENDKFYFGKDVFRKDSQNVSLGMMGLLDKYSTFLALNTLKHPWITINDIKSWCNDDREAIEQYIQEGIQNGCLIQLNEVEARRLQKNPLENNWLFE